MRNIPFRRRSFIGHVDTVGSASTSEPVRFMSAHLGFFFQCFTRPGHLQPRRRRPIMSATALHRGASASRQIAYARNVEVAWLEHTDTTVRVVFTCVLMSRISNKSKHCPAATCLLISTSLLDEWSLSIFRPSLLPAPQVRRPVSNRGIVNELEC